MNPHIIRAREFAQRGDAYYVQCADEIEAARTDGESWRVIADGMGRTESWVRAVVSARRGGDLQPFSEAAGKPNRDDSGARKVLRERPEVVAADIPSALEDDAVRAAVLSSPAGIAAVQSMGRELAARSAFSGPPADPLPTPPAFAGAFWRAVGAVDAAGRELDRFGPVGLDLEPEAREAAERMHRRAGEISAAVIERAVESNL